MSDIFTFGKVKGKRMTDVINATQGGLAYLCYIYTRTDKQYIKEEIETCLKKYSCIYVIQFGMYAGKTLADIDSENSKYITEYLIKNKNEEIQMVVKYYLSNFRNMNMRQYNHHQEQTYLKYSEIQEQVNKSTAKDIELVLNYLGINTRNKCLEKCPWGCEKTSSRYEHAYIFKGSNKSWLIRCCKCTQAQNFIKFVAEHKNVTHNEALDWIASILHIAVNQQPKVYTPTIKQRTIGLETIELHSMELPEINLNSFALTQEYYPPYFYNRGFVKDDAKYMNVYFQKNFDKSGFWNRICFVVHDLQNRPVGIIGRNIIQEKEHYNYWINRFKIDTSLPFETQMELVKKANKKYIKYYNNFQTGNVLYNANMLVDSLKDKVFLCEGPFDVLKMVIYGYSNTVGMAKNVLSPGQLYQLFQLYKDVRATIKIYLVVDGDEAGENGFRINVKKLQQIGFRNIYKMTIKGSKDACEATKEQIDQAYRDAQLQTLEYKKKRIILLDVDTQQTKLLEE